MKKYRCPHCGNTFIGQIDRCPHCGKPLSYGGVPTPPPPVHVNPPKIEASPRGFNFLHFLLTTFGLGFGVMTVFLPIFMNITYVGGEPQENAFSLFNELQYLVSIWNDSFASWDWNNFTSSANFLARDIFMIVAVVYSGTFSMLQLIWWFRSLGYFFSNKIPPELKSKGFMGNYGQFGGALGLLILAYLNAFVPYLLGLWIINIGTGDSGFVDFLRMFVDGSNFHGLSYLHIVYAVTFGLICLFSIIRLGVKKSFREKLPKHLRK